MYFFKHVHDTFNFRNIPGRQVYAFIFFYNLVFVFTYNLRFTWKGMRLYFCDITPSPHGTTAL